MPKKDDMTEVLEKIDTYPEPYNKMLKRVHEIMMERVPELKPRLWYGMPGYARSGPVLCYFRVDGDLMTFGFTEKANFAVEDGASDQLIPAAWYFTDLDDATEARIASIVEKATS